MKLKKGKYFSNIMDLCRCEFINIASFRPLTDVSLEDLGPEQQWVIKS